MVKELRGGSRDKFMLGNHVPLREFLIAADVSFLAGPTPFPGFGMALSRRSSSGSSHHVQVLCGEGLVLKRNNRQMNFC